MSLYSCHHDCVWKWVTMTMGVATTRETTDSVLQVRRHPKTSTLFLYKFAGLPKMKRKQNSKHTKNSQIFSNFALFSPNCNLRGFLYLIYGASGEVFDFWASGFRSFRLFWWSFITLISDIQSDFRNSKNSCPRRAAKNTQLDQLWCVWSKAPSIWKYSTYQLCCVWSESHKLYLLARNKPKKNIFK